MLIEQLVGKRLPDAPREAQSAGHTLLLRGGYIRQIGTGIYALLPLGQRACRKVEQIIREEMEAVGCQEVLMPVTTPADLWIESGRYQKVGPELLRFEDRTGAQMVLNMTHEEVVVEVARSQVETYRQFPFGLFQIQTKFRDEPRSRGGLIRVREFTMKDAYTFHRTQECLERTYAAYHEAYTRIFKRIGLRNVIDVQADSGMMGGAISHEFMLVTPIGEDPLVVCEESGYRANREVAAARREFPHEGEAQAPMTEVHTPGQKTIEEVAAFLKTTPERTCKCVAFVGDDGRNILAFIRGDMEVNQQKLKGVARTRELRPMMEDEFAEFGGVPGYCGAVGLDEMKVEMFFDESVARTPNLVVGANKTDWHCTGFNFARDFPQGKVVDLYEVQDGDACPLSGKPLRVVRGVEVGNIFQLGTKYSEAMNFTYSEEDGSLRTPIMGCYGIGVGRCFASVAEESNDKHGPFWPLSIAPFQVQVCALQAAKDPQSAQVALEVYDKLKTQGVEVVLDARNVAPGFMFADADLVGAPVRVIISPRNLKNNVAEIKYRLAEPREDLPKELPLEGLAAKVHEIVRELLAPYTASGVR